MPLPVWASRRDFTIAIDELHEINIWSDFVQTMESGVTRASRRERRVGIQIHDFGAIFASPLGRAITRSGIHIYDLGRRLGERSEAFLQAVAFVAANSNGGKSKFGVSHRRLLYCPQRSHAIRVLSL